MLASVRHPRMFGLLMTKKMLVEGKLCKKRNKPINNSQMTMTLMAMDLGLLVPLQETHLTDPSLIWNQMKLLAGSGDTWGHQAIQSHLEQADRSQRQSSNLLEMILTTLMIWWEVMVVLEADCLTMNPSSLEIMLGMMTLIWCQRKREEEEMTMTLLPSFRELNKKNKAMPREKQWWNRKLQQHGKIKTK